MIEAKERFPLTWPAGWKRTPAGARKRAHFRTSEMVYSESNSWRRAKELSVADAIKRLRGELRRLGAADDWLISSNVRVRLDGLPYSSDKPPSDPGVAVYFRLKQKDRCLACDTWDRVADNIAAIAQHIDALRRIDRYGVGTLDQAFAGYTQLQSAAVDWWLVIGVPRTATLEEIERAYREKIVAVHPDRHSSELQSWAQAESSKLNEARDRARAEKGA